MVPRQRRVTNADIGDGILNAKAWPSELRVSKDKKTLTVRFTEGGEFRLPAEFLRVLSPSAEVQGHSPDQKQTVHGKRKVEIMQVEPVGNYAVKIVFDDMHYTGIYSWDYLMKLGREQDDLWNGYLAELEEKGLTRDR
ncbi:DUF971 domain-containing protein [Breoghania sp.]|uniref:DUF971 domain-containing protein n=1 Tax=Breoghania sp. TaxID=2065378 RepID=UPI00260B240E|nr:DUF971 domain-containing protein [Breoghania sp.]MDJ0929645.1 DUF971 domain-containing protein [Breoghania sp.]